MLSASLVHSQSDSFRLSSGVKVYSDSRIDSLIYRYYKNDDDQPKIQGYRIQIYSGSSHVDAKKAKTDFLQIYESPSVYLIYKQPNYKVRVGDYRNRVEAQKLFHQLLSDGNFKAVLIVPDVINLPDL